jgi:hypothetical protein
MCRAIMNLVVIPLLVAFCAVSALSPTARATVIETQTILQAQPLSTQDQLQNFLARSDVSEQLIALGVDPEYVEMRIAGLTDWELNQLQQHIKDLPAAGSDTFVVLGIIFLVLIVLELFGVTNIFRTR